MSVPVLVASVVLGLVGPPLAALPAIRRAARRAQCGGERQSWWALIGRRSRVAAEAHGECGGPGVGAINTGGFALAMAVEPAVLAPVLSQPGLPAPITAGKRAAVGLDDADLPRVKQRAQDGMGVLGLRFTADKGCPGARVQTLRRELGERFVIDSSPGSPCGIPAHAHAVLTVDLADEPGHPTRAALDRVMTFLAERLLAAD